MKGNEEMSEVTLGRLQNCTFEQVTRLWNEGFEGYYSDMSKTTAQLLSKLSNQYIQPELSVVAYDGNRPIGFVFIAVKEVQGKKLAWNGGSGLARTYRGQGIGKRMMIEAESVIREQGVDTAYLEVVTKNESAIGSYKAAGFRIADTLIGMKHIGVLQPSVFQLPEESDLRIREARCIEAANLPFYKEDAAFLCQWHNIRDGKAVIAYGPGGRPVGYALFKCLLDQAGICNSIYLFQCEADPEYANASEIYRSLLSRVFATNRPSSDFFLSVSDLSIGSPMKKEVLLQAGFTQLYEQYLMILHP